MIHLRSALLALAVGASSPSWVGAQSVAEQVGACAPVAIPGHYGPFDYVTQRNSLAIVERFHFTPQVENLRGGSSGFLGGDLSYTLNASPNHHRALLAAMRYAIREKTDEPRHMRFSISCYFDRALRFRPKDTVVRGLYAKYLLDFLKRKEDAVRQVDIIVEFAGDNPFTHHNAGMLYFEMGEHAKAVERAQRARELGYPRDDLIAKLRQAGHWPTESPAPPPVKEQP
jgi:hypothetical protein